MLAALRFLWRSTAGYRWRPWRSPLLRWRIETYSGRPAESIGLGAFVWFCWRQRRELLRFLAWCGHMNRQRRLSGHPGESAHAGPGESS